MEVDVGVFPGRYVRLNTNKAVPDKPNKFPREFPSSNVDLFPSKTAEL